MAVAARKRRERGSITADAIITGAFAVAEREGLDRMSMTELASELGVGVTSIYWYFRSKDDLLRRMSEVVTLENQDRLPRPSEYAPADWRRFLENYAQQLRENYGTSDLYVDLTLMRTAHYTLAGTQRVFERMEATLGLLLDAGFTQKVAWSVLSLLSIYTRGFVMTVRNRRLNQTPPPGTRQLNLIDEGEMPILANLIRTGDISLDQASDSDYDSGVKKILDQAEHLLEPQPNS